MHANHDAVDNINKATDTKKKTNIREKNSAIASLTFMHMHVHTCTHACAHTHRYTYTHVHTHAHTDECVFDLSLIHI